MPVMASVGIEFFLTKIHVIIPDPANLTANKNHGATHLQMITKTGDEFADKAIKSDTKAVHSQ